MTTGTVIVQDALRLIGAHSPFSPADPDAIVFGISKLNSMLEAWLTKGIKIGFTPLEVPGDNANEPIDTLNGIVSNLALELAPAFDNGKQIVSADLRTNATRSFADIKNVYQSLSVPNKVVSSTLPVGAGNNTRRFNDQVYFPVGQTLGKNN